MVQTIELPDEVNLERILVPMDMVLIAHKNLTLSEIKRVEVQAENQRLNDELTVASNRIEDFTIKLASSSTKGSGAGVENCSR
jgi:hypothetical protein